MGIPGIPRSTGHVLRYDRCKASLVVDKRQRPVPVKDAGCLIYTEYVEGARGEGSAVDDYESKFIGARGFMIVLWLVSDAAPVHETREPFEPVGNSALCARLLLLCVCVFPSRFVSWKIEQSRKDSFWLLYVALERCFLINLRSLSKFWESTTLIILL